MNVKTFEEWSSSYNEDFHCAIDAAVEFSGAGDLKSVVGAFSKLNVKRDSNAGIIARIVRLLIHTKYKEGSGEYRELVVKDAPELLDDLSSGNFTEYDANLLATIVIRNIKMDEEIYLKTLEQRLKFAGAQFEILLIHPKIREFASNVDEGLAKIWN